MNKTDTPRLLYLDTVRFYLERVQDCDSQTIEDVTALCSWSECAKMVEYAATGGASLIFAMAITNAQVALAWLEANKCRL